jgi:membrane-associated protein
MLEWLHQLHDVQALTGMIASYGLMLLVGIVFAETALLIGVILPGDSLLFLAGALCSVNLVDPAAPPPLGFWTTTGALIVAAILGNSVNWLLGKWTGDRAWNWPDGRLFKRRYLADAHAFYERWGALSLVLTRFIPIARSFVPFIAGISRMRFPAYTLWNVIGALVWVPSLMATGFWLGRVQWVRQNLEAIVLAVIVISVTPMVIGGLLRWRSSRLAARAGHG